MVLVCVVCFRVSLLTHYVGSAHKTGWQACEECQVLPLELPSRLSDVVMSDEQVIHVHGLHPHTWTHSLMC